MKAKEAKPKIKSAKLSDFLIPEFLVACHEAVLGQDNGLTLVKIIDQLIAIFMPLQNFRFVLVAQFIRRLEVDPREFSLAGLYYRIVLVKPSGHELLLTEGPILIDADAPWLSTRLINDLSSMISLDETGMYRLKLSGKTFNSEYEDLLEKQLSVIIVPGVNGLYVAQFSDESTKNYGFGIVMLMPNQTIQGTDHAYGYSGTYRTDGEEMFVRLLARRQTRGALSIFGDIEQFELELHGVVKDQTIDLSGYMVGDTKHKLRILATKQITPPNMAEIVASSKPLQNDS